jgi:hypothetical protein
MGSRVAFYQGIAGVFSLPEDGCSNKSPITSLVICAKSNA